MLSGIRLETIHPVLVHFTLGALSVIVVAYAVAAWRRSERWTFAGDVALTITAAITFVTFAFGLVSNAMVPWPGGLGLWRWLHLGFGALVTFLLAVFAIARLAQRRRRPESGLGAMTAAFTIAIVAAWAGWIGGEVLVYHSGMAVQAAADGALAPPLFRPRGEPRDLLDAMDQVRASWSAASTDLAGAVVQHPTARTYEAVKRDARRVEQLGSWMAVEGPKSLPRAEEPVGLPPVASAAPDPPAGRITRGQRLTQLAELLKRRGLELEQTAARKDVEDMTRATGLVGAACADCHEELRWRR